MTKTVRSRISTRLPPVSFCTRMAVTSTRRSEEGTRCRSCTSASRSGRPRFSCRKISANSDRTGSWAFSASISIALTTEWPAREASANISIPSASTLLNAATRRDRRQARTIGGHQTQRGPGHYVDQKHPSEDPCDPIPAGKQCTARHYQSGHRDCAICLQDAQLHGLGKAIPFEEAVKPAEPACIGRLQELLDLGRRPVWLAGREGNQGHAMGNGLLLAGLSRHRHDRSEADHEHREKS